MDALVEMYSSSMNRYIYEHHSSISSPLIRTHVINGYSPDHSYTQFPIHSNDRPTRSPVDVSPAASFLSSELEPEGDVTKKPDYYEGVLKYLNQMLMEEDDLQNKPCMLNECLALQVQAAEKSLYDVLVDKHPTSPNPLSPFSDDYFPGTCSSGDSNSTNHSTSYQNNMFQSNLQSFGSSSSTNLYDVEQWLVGSPENTPFQAVRSSSNDSRFSPLPVFIPEAEKNGSTGKRNFYRTDGDCAQEERGNKQFASSAEDSDPLEMSDYDKVLLYETPHLQNESFHQASQASRKKGVNWGKKKENRKEVVVDLRSLLTQCAQAMTNSNSSSAREVLKKIRQHSSPYGDSTERLAHYFANGIEARLAGTGPELYRAIGTRRISAAQTIKAYHSYITACPFHKMSNILANGSIKLIAKGRKKLHIIDFGILYGFQWPCFIQHLSLRPEGPPKLRITGIDLPQPGFHPAERIKETGHRLANYCKRFNVPFEYNAIAKKWEDIRIENLKLERDELVVVNCMYRLRNVPDETVVESSPRDAVLDLIKRINPDMFVHGVLNGTYNAPFLLTRFREALFHFSTLFDMFDTTAPRGDKDRLLFEQEQYARDVMNVIACEGTSRVERPETYRQWQSRNVRAGFRQLPLNPHIVKEVRAKVKLSYHKDFLVDEDSNWMLQGWKGRVLYAFSLWKPVQGK